MRGGGEGNGDRGVRRGEDEGSRDQEGQHYPVIVLVHTTPEHTEGRPSV